MVRPILQNPAVLAHCPSLPVSGVGGSGETGSGTGTSESVWH